MPHDYTSFITRFYAATDNATDHDAYCSFFTPTATLAVGLRTIHERSGIHTLRQEMWAAVSTRKHVVTKTFAATDGSDEVMLFGTVDYTLKTGKALSSEWAARMVFDGGAGDEKMKFYQVYLDASPMIVAQGKSIVPDAEGNVSVV